jgi:2'-5' RNA ligase
MNFEHTLPSEQRDFVAWHRGRPHYALWAVALDDAAIDARLEQLCRALQPLLLPGYRRRAHVTLQLCGFAVDAPAAAGDFGPRQLQAQLDALARLRLPPFELRIGGAFSFAAAACLAVQDPSGSLARLRAALAAAAADDDATPYRPHVTAGLYGGAWPVHEIRQRLRALQSLPDIAVPVTQLDWMHYDTAVVGGPLRTLRRVELPPGG